MEAVTLAEALGELRRELYEAQDEGVGQQLQFEVEQAQLTLEVEFRRDKDGKVKVEVGLPGAKVGGEGGGGSGRTHRQTLTLALQVHDEALGGSRAKIRHSTSDDPGAAASQTPGTVQPDGTSAEPPTAAGAEQKRPWEQ
ncbi:trypco2 family protein [Streptomyces sp. CWNU-52B]|uniref:trypco2 family protein n=1 Tax=unclassified Streptomyces TaxID=2593676 RepID=UPI0039C1030B